MKQSKFLSLKEFVIVLLLACVETAIGLVVTMPFAANLQLVYLDLYYQQHFDLSRCIEAF